MGLEWGDHEGEVPFPSYDISVSLMTQAVITWMRFPIINTLYSPLPYYTLQKRGSYSKGKELNINHLHKLFGVQYRTFISFPHLLIYSVIY